LNTLYRSKLVVGSMITASLVLLSSPAWAVTTYTGVPAHDGASASTDILAFLGTMVSAIAPVFIAVAGGVVGITILAWGIKTVFRKVRGAAHF
jgi:hypothetical protein